MNILDAIRAITAARQAANLQTANELAMQSMAHCPNGQSGAGCRKSDILEGSSTGPGRLFRVRNRKWAKKYHSRKIRYDRSWMNPNDFDDFEPEVITLDEFMNSDWQVIGSEDIDFEDSFESGLKPFWEPSRQDKFLEWVYPGQDMIDLIDA